MSLYDDLQDTLKSFNNAMEKELEDIRQCKADVQRLYAEMQDQLNRCRFIGDDRRIILSAPEIIIGDVDAEGQLHNRGSRVIIRSNHISLQGVGDGVGTNGLVSVQAPCIEQTAVDTGIDGKEAVLQPVSSISQQAATVNLSGMAQEGTYVCFTPPTQPGVHIQSDSQVDIESAQSITGRADLIKNKLDELKNQLSDAKDAVSNLKSALDAQAGEIDDMVSNPEEVDLDDMDTLNTEVVGYMMDQQVYRTRMEEFVSLSAQYAHSMSDYAEMNRRKTVLENEQKELDTLKSAAEQAALPPTLSLRSQNISISTRDGDGGQKALPGVGVRIETPRTEINSTGDDGALLDGSGLVVQTQSIAFSTMNTKYSDADKRTDGDITATGSINLLSKDIHMQSVDYELKGGELAEKDITKEGSITMRAETLSLAATDKEGKATGSLSLNAKAVELKAMDQKQEDDKPATDAGLAAGGTVVVAAEKVLAGSKSQDAKAKLVQLAADTVGLFADTTAEMQQGEGGKAVLTLDGGKAGIGGDATQIYGDATLNGKTEMKDELKGTKIKADAIEASSALKSPNIEDGMAASGGGGGDKAKAKLKAEEVKSES